MLKKNIRMTLKLSTITTEGSNTLRRKNNKWKKFHAADGRKRLIFEIIRQFFFNNEIDEVQARENEFFRH